MNDAAATFANFVILVRDMRAAQRLYFRTRSALDLRDAKKLEAEVDRLADELMRSAKPVPVQRSLL